MQNESDLLLLPLIANVAPKIDDTLVVALFALSQSRTQKVKGCHPQRLLFLLGLFLPLQKSRSFTAIIGLPFTFIPS